MEKNVRLKHRKLYLIFRFLQGSKIYFAAAIAASLISTILNALTPQIFRFSIDEVLSGNIGNSTDTALLPADFMAVSNICCLPSYQSPTETHHLFPAVSFFTLTNTLCTP